MDADDITHSSSERLASLLSLDVAPQKIWPKADLAAILRHQLDAPLSYDLERAGRADVDAADRVRLAEITRTSALPLSTFRDLLLHPTPPLPMLRTLKIFAKTGGQADGMLPGEIASLLYYLSIALARSRHRESISALDDASIIKGLDWAVQRAWIEPDIRSVCETCKVDLAAMNG